MIYINQLKLSNNNILNILDNKTKLNKLLIKHNNKYIYINIINYININITLNYIYISLKPNFLISKKFFILFNKLIKKNILNNTFNYSIKLMISGIGYFFKVKNNNTLTIKVENTHLINIILPKDINFNIENNGLVLILKSFNKELLTLIASKIKLSSKFNIYKGKGIYYSDEKINLKNTKKIKTS
uniref:50S ribosomal protein L6 n=1 Tax=Nephromyces sp. ex Molgula occidentalis TaxID=2544991 RepID=A0A5C1H8R6_9APIC|nr:50S ribosomal protein L6 [Nephromyces sp. ex Molgula occidentalis]